MGPAGQRGGVSPHVLLKGGGKSVDTRHPGLSLRLDGGRPARMLVRSSGPRLVWMAAGHCAEFRGACLTVPGSPF